MKQHLPALDGLRGIAAMSVVLFHFQYLTMGIATPTAPWFRHAYLAVDFFFCLSGYVLAYNYDDRRDRMTVRDFLVLRLIRLHPMVIIGTLVGLASYVLDPYNSAPSLPAWLEAQNPPLWKLITAAVGGAFMVPTWSLPNRMGAYFSLNTASWSLMWEYIASLAFALLLWRAKRSVLAVVVVLAAVGVGFSAHSFDRLWGGFAWGQMSDAFVRGAFSFCTGVLLFRSGAAIRAPIGFIGLSALMVLLFIAPKAPFGIPNWIYDWVVAVAVMPLIVALGAGATAAPGMAKVCDLFGRVSYPLYILHATFMALFIHYYWSRGIPVAALPWAVAGVATCLALIAYAALVLYDEPVRRWLRQRFTARRD